MSRLLPVLCIGIPVAIISFAVALGAAFFYGVGPVEYLIDRDTIHHL